MSCCVVKYILFFVRFVIDNANTDVGFLYHRVILHSFLKEQGVAPW